MYGDSVEVWNGMETAVAELYTVHVYGKHWGGFFACMYLSL